MSNIDNFKGDALITGGARANLFEVTLADATLLGADEGKTLTFTCKAAQLPASVIAQIDVPYRGRQLKVAGDRTFENWTITVYNENSQKVRSGFEGWMNRINQHVNNIGTLQPSSYMADITVKQLDREGGNPKTYEISDAFPVNVSAIDLSYDANDAIEEFTVEFAYQYWTSNTTS